MNTPRGIRNKNPLNIRRTQIHWLGMCEQQTDAAFCQFTDMRYGIRAAARVIKTYVSRYNCRTVQDIIHRWAPPSDGNNTGKYVRTVCNGSAFLTPTTIIDPDNDEQLTHLLQRMAFVECGYIIPYETVRQGVQMRKQYSL